MSGTTTTLTTTLTLTTTTGTMTTVGGLTVQSGQTVTVPAGVTENRPVVRAGGELVLSSGASASIVTLSPSATLVLDPGSFASSTGFTNATLELAAGTGGSAGMLNAGNLGLSSSTGTLRVDSGSRWTVNGNIGSTATATTVSGTTVGGLASVTLSNSGSIDISGTAILAAIVGDTGSGTTAGGLLQIGAGSDVDVLGAVSRSQTVSFGSGATLELATPGSFSGTLEQFVLGDTLVLDGFTGMTAVVTDGALAILGSVNGTQQIYQFELAGTPANEHYTLSTSNGRTFVTGNVACFCAGTLILTSEGEVAVEKLTSGDIVATAFGQHRPIRWIGRRSYVGRFLAANPAAQPIRFRTGSLGDGLPRRDLLMSPGHAMFLDGMLIPAGLLVNSSTITVERGLNRVDYYHVELDSHDVLLAEGAPSESYADDGDSYRFHNAVERPDRAGRVALCAPRVESGFVLEAIRARLALVTGEVALVA